MRNLFITAAIALTTGLLLGFKANVIFNNLTKSTNPVITDTNKTIISSNTTEQDKKFYFDKEGCEITDKYGCQDYLTCTGIANLTSETKSDLLMSEYKAKGFALNFAAEHIKRTENPSQIKLDDFMQNYKTLATRYSTIDKLVYVTLGKNCN